MGLGAHTNELSTKRYVRDILCDYLRDMSARICTTFIRGVRRTNDLNPNSVPDDESAECVGGYSRPNAYTRVATTILYRLRIVGGNVRNVRFTALLRKYVRNPEDIRVYVCQLDTCSDYRRKKPVSKSPDFAHAQSIAKKVCPQSHGHVTTLTNASPQFVDDLTVCVRVCVVRV